MSEEVENIQDVFGQDILPGSLLAIRRADRGHSLELSIVVGFGYRRRNWSTNSKQEVVRVVRLGWGKADKVTKGWIEIVRGYNDNIIVVEPGQAFLALNNDKIKKVLRAVDLAKDEGLLPDDYKLGKPFATEQIFPEDE